MRPDSIASILVAFIAAAFAYASSRSATKSSKMHDASNFRLEMEKDAYERARALDTETIARQSAEIKDLREDNRRLDDRVNTLLYQIIRIQQGLSPNLEEDPDDRADEPPAVPEH